jgi:hypothetical protein
VTAARSGRSQLSEQAGAAVQGALALLPDGAAAVSRVLAERPVRPAVVVVGETKRGKSSLINALLNTPGLSPVDVAVATSSYLVFQHAARDCARAVLRMDAGERDRRRQGLRADADRVATAMSQVDAVLPLLRAAKVVRRPPARAVPAATAAGGERG